MTNIDQQIVQHAIGSHKHKLKRVRAAVGERERVIASTDCGFGTFTNREWVIEPVVWLKLRALREGADIASARLWGKKSAA